MNLKQITRPMKAKTVSESIEFQRGIGSKKALSAGREELLKTKEGLSQVFETEMEELRPMNVRFYEFDDEMDEMTFDLSEEIYFYKFNSIERNLSYYLSQWFDKTPYSIYGIQIINRYGKNIAGEKYYTFVVDIKKRKNNETN
jgi:hypothetical protein